MPRALTGSCGSLHALSAPCYNPRFSEKVNAVLLKRMTTLRKDFMHVQELMRSSFSSLNADTGATASAIAVTSGSRPSLSSGAPTSPSAASLSAPPAAASAGSSPPGRAAGGADGPVMAASELSSARGPELDALALGGAGGRPLSLEEVLQMSQVVAGGSAAAPGAGRGGVGAVGALAGQGSGSAGGGYVVGNVAISRMASAMEPVLR